VYKREKNNEHGTFFSQALITKKQTGGAGTEETMTTSDKVG
jgi:hypothetical protein